MKNFVNKIFVPKKAFSLIELSIVIVVISIVITGMLTVLVNSSVVNKTAKTKERMELIYKAMGVYLLKNKHLPCPAPITALRTSADYGKAGGSTGTCTDQSGVYTKASPYNLSAYGMVPTKDLGLTTDFAEDGFGSKFAYVVYKNFTIEGDYATEGFSTASPENVGIYVKQQGIRVDNNSEGAAFAIISYGANKFGSFAATSSTQNTQNTALSGDAEQYNYPTSFVDNASPTEDTATFKDESTPTNKIVLQTSVNSSGGTFDDVVFYKTRNDIVRDFDALFLIRCPKVDYSLGSGDANYVKYGASTYIAWSKGGKYGQNVVADNDSAGTDPNMADTPCPSGWTAKVKYPARKCGAFGAWENGGSGLTYDGAPDPDPIVIPCSQ